MQRFMDELNHTSHSSRGLQVYLCPNMLPYTLFPFKCSYFAYPLNKIKSIAIVSIHHTHARTHPRTHANAHTHSLSLITCDEDRLVNRNKGELGLAVGAQVTDKTNLCAEASRAVGAGDGRRVGGRVVDAQFLCFSLHFCCVCPGRFICGCSRF